MAAQSSDEEHQWAAEKRDFVGDRRDALADERDLAADVRDLLADAREHALAERERRLEAREAHNLYAGMAAETIGVLENVVEGSAHLVGWSDGGIIALLVALQRPDLVRKLVVIGANFHYDGMVPVEMDPDSPMAQELGKAVAGDILYPQRP